MSKNITVEITPAGNVKVEAHNFQGCGCTDATQQIEVAIGGTAPKKKDMKPEFYQQASGTTENNLTF